MNVKRNITTWLSLSCFVLLAACGGGGGGGGGDDESGNANSNAVTPGAVGPAGYTEGTWVGPYAGFYNTRIVVLSTGEFFGVYETGATVAGALYGQLRDSGGVKGSIKDFSLNTLRADEVAVTGTVSAQQTMLIDRDGQKLDLTYSASMNNSMSLSSLAGVYSGRGGNSFGPAEVMNVTINANGVIDLPEPVCSSSGQIKPSPAGNNVFTLNLTITGNNCARRGNTLNGVLYQDPNNQRVYLLGLNNAKTDAAIFYGVNKLLNAEYRGQVIVVALMNSIMVFKN